MAANRSGWTLVFVVLSVVGVVVLYRGIASSPAGDSDGYKVPIDTAVRERGSRREFKVEPPPPNDHDFYALETDDYQGDEVLMERFRGKVLLIVNTASHDPEAERNFKELQTLHERYHEAGLEILAFPCNQFGKGDTGTDIEIQHYAATEFGVKFPFMARVDVNGVNMSPVWRFLKTSFPGMIKWNFSGKFLIDRQGKAVKRSRFFPLQLEESILDLLQTPAH